MSCVPPYAEAEFCAKKQAGAPREDDVPSRDEAEAPERDVPSLPVYAASTWRIGRVAPFVVALVLAILAGCAPGAESREAKPSPLPSPAARPAYPWCGHACDDLPNLGREPRVSGRVVYTIEVVRP